MMGSTRQSRDGGFTLVELLVVVALVAMLIGLLLPAVNGAREASRRAICMNQLRQIALASIQHESAHHHFPTGGWGFNWVGDPDRGFGEHQPGGWVYGVLPFIEQNDLRQLGMRRNEEQKLEFAAQVVQTPLAGFNCPSRREGLLVLFADESEVWRPFNSGILVGVTKSDYAINAGDTDPGGGPGPESIQESRAFKWNDFRKASGLSFTRSEVSVERIRDGTSKTYLVGEKSVNQSLSKDQGDDQSMFCGYDYDNYRWALLGQRPTTDADASPDSFGSIHSGGVNMAMTDGSSRVIGYEIEPDVHRRLSNRHDGLTVEF